MTSGNNENPQEAQPDTRPDLVRAINAVVLELADILSDYRDAFVISGGLALQLLFPPMQARRLAGIPIGAEDEPEPFERLTKDVDLILNVMALNEMLDENTPAIGELLTQNLYQEEPGRHYWTRIVNLPGFLKPMAIPVEFLAPGRFADESTDATILAHMSALQDVTPAPLGGVDLVLLQPWTLTLSGVTPTMRRLVNVPVQVVDPAMLILVKAIAFKDRLHKHQVHPDGEKHLFHATKHAYDISECLRRYPGKMEALAKRLAPLWLRQAGVEQRLADDALECLRAHFASPTAEGPRRMVDEERYRLDDENEKMVARRLTARLVQQLLRLLDERCEAIL